MRLDRRAFAAGGSAVLLSSCATMPRQASAPCSPLAPVKVDASRVIRAAAGLRPYRAAGFVVRREQLGDKALVHNYGHGGAGITLSWGSSRLAVDLGLPGHSGPVAVIGAGALGLTTARLVQEAGFPVTVYAAALPPDTTSNVAGGEWSPSVHYERSEVTPEWERQFAAAADYSYRRFRILEGEEHGVRWMPKYALSNRPLSAGSGPMAPHRPHSRPLAPGEHPFPYPYVRRHLAMYVETHRFLARLMEDVLRFGGKIELRRFATPADVAGLSERLVFNCTGLGARELFGDSGLQPVRGQLAILAPQPEVQYALATGSLYMFPRPDGIILGGTYEYGEESSATDPGDIARILADHRRLFASFRCAA